MNFKSGISGLGSGSVCYAAAEGESMSALVKFNGAIRRVDVNLTTKAMKNCGTVSLADECMLTATGRIEKLGEVYYVEG